MESHLHLSPASLLAMAIEMGVILGVIRFAAHVRQHAAESNGKESKTAAFLLAVYG